MRTPLLLAIALCLALSVPVCAQSFLDDYLHNIKIDQATAPRPSGVDNLQSQFLESPKVFGQSFTTGPDVTEIYQIAVESPWWNDSWTKDTSLVMTLYDGPAKRRKLAEFAMKYDWRAWEDMKIVFPMKVAAFGKHEYYFELRAEGGAGKIGPIITAPSDYPGGSAFIDGKPQSFDFEFQDYVHTNWDRDAAYREAFAKFNLDYPPLAKVKAAVAAANWEVAAKELVAHFESRPDLVPPPDKRKKPGSSPRPDFREADVALQAEMALKDADGNTVSLGPNWNHLRWWPTRGGIGLTRTGIRGALAAGYSNTGNEKYAIAFNDMLKATLIDLPGPIRAGVIPPDAKETPPILPGGIAGGSMYAGLSTGARMGHGFAYYAQFVDSPNFAWDVRAAFIMNLADMADVLAAQKGGGNWATQMTDSLFDFGKTYPEFARSKEFFQTGYDGLLANMRETLAPDGPIGESQAYQGLVHGRYIQIPKDARNLGLPFPEDVHKKIELAMQFHMYTITPDGYMPAFGDANPDSECHGMLKDASVEFSRPDFLYVATGGKEGRKPERTSFEFPYSKYYISRTDWTPDALYMCLKNGGYTAHGHRDSLGFVMYAYGSPLLIDPGVYIYGTPQAVRLGETKSHSSVTVDGRNLQNGGSPNQFFIGESVDLLVAQGPNYEGLPESINTVRRVAFLKPNYWVFSDAVRGSGQRQVDLWWHYPDKDVTLDAKTGVATTTHPKGGNLALIPVDPKAVGFRLEEGDVAGHREALSPAWILRQGANAELPYRVDNVLYPFKTQPDAKVTQLEVKEGADAETTGIGIATAKGSDVVIFTSGPGHKVGFTDGTRAAAQTAVLRRDKTGKVRSFSWMWGSWLVASRGPGKTLVLATAKRPIAGLDVVYAGDTVRVTARGGDPSLMIAALGAKKVSVNGGSAVAIKAKVGMFAPFAGEPIDFILTDDELPGFAIEKPLVGGNAGGEDQVGFTYQMCHVSPGRPSLMSYTPNLPSPGLYEVSVFVPRTANPVGITKEAHYTVRFKPSSGWGASLDERVKPPNTAKAETGVIELRVDQNAAAGSWVDLGRFEFGKPGEAKLELQADGDTRGPVVLADGVRWRRVDK